MLLQSWIFFFWFLFYWHQQFLCLHLIKFMDIRGFSFWCNMQEHKREEDCKEVGGSWNSLEIPCTFGVQKLWHWAAERLKKMTILLLINRLGILYSESKRMTWVTLLKKGVAGPNSSCFRENICDMTWDHNKK